MTTDSERSFKLHKDDTSYVLVSGSEDTSDWEGCSIYSFPWHAIQLIEDDDKFRAAKLALYESGVPIIASSVFDEWVNSIDEQLYQIRFSNLPRDEIRRQLALLPNPFLNKTD